MNATTASSHMALTSADLAGRIKQLLGKGLSSTVVASAVGCDPSYVSQLMEDPEFKNAVLVMRAGDAESALSRDGRWDSIEEKTLAKLEEVLPLVSRPSDLIRIASMANAAKRTAKELANANETAAPTVTFMLPESAVIHFKMNATAQVVEVEGRSMAALPAARLQEQLRARTVERLEAGVQDVTVATPTPTLTERKKVESTLERLGLSDVAVPVPKLVMGN